MNTLIKNFFLSAVGFGLPMGLLIGFIEFSVLTGVISGALMGMAFGLIVSLFQVFQTMKFKKMEAAIPDLIFSGAANHFANGEAAGGWLLLTPTQLIFKSHKINLSSHEFILELKDILSVEPVLTLGVIPNGLLVSTMERKERFVVSERKNWVEKILKAKANM